MILVSNLRRKSIRYAVQSKRFAFFKLTYIAHNFNRISNSNVVIWIIKKVVNKVFYSVIRLIIAYDLWPSPMTLVIIIWKRFFLPSKTLPELVKAATEAPMIGIHVYT